MIFVAWLWDVNAALKWEQPLSNAVFFSLGNDFRQRRVCTMEKKNTETNHCKAYPLYESKGESAAIHVGNVGDHVIASQQHGVLSRVRMRRVVEIQAAVL